MSSGQLPELTGDVTSPAGSGVTTLAATTNGTLATLTRAAGVAVRGTNTNNSAAAGYIGEYVEATVIVYTAVPAANNQFGDLTSISLTAGDWDVTLVVQLNNNGATATVADIGISTTTGNSATGMAYGVNLIEMPWQAVAAADASMVIPSYRMSLNATTTVYAKNLVTYSAGTPRYKCCISARRVR